MADLEEYQIVDNDRIVPVYSMGTAKRQPEAENFEAALMKILTTTGLEDAGLADNDADTREPVKRNISEFFSTYYLDAEEALYILTGIMPRWAGYRFEWENKVYLTMRPRFGLLCITKNFGKMPINCYERAIRDRLLNYAHEEIEAIYRAIKNGEILENTREAPFDQWIALFQKRGFDLSHIPDKYLSDPLSRLTKKNNELIEALENLKNENDGLYEKLRQFESETKSVGRDRLSLRSETTFLNIIAALLEFIAGKSPGMARHPNFVSEAKLIEHFSEFGMPGLSKSSLESKFAAAKRCFAATNYP